MKLSVVIPTHNRADLLARAVRSAQAEGAEVVVVDDASGDDTPQRMAELGVAGVRLEVNRGPGHARNVGTALATGDVVLYLDDDDTMRPGAGDVIRSLARAHPEEVLFLHNCAWPDGTTSIAAETPPTRLDYRGWLEGRFAGELKPVCRRSLFDEYEYEDTGASGEALLWGRVIRAYGAIVSGVPVVDYNDVGVDRLTSAVGLLERAAANARIAERWLEEFGEDLRRLDSGAWRTRVLAAATYRLVAGDRALARGHLRRLRAAAGTPPAAIALALVTALPTPVARLAFLAHRRELAVAMRSGRLRAALLG